MNKYKKGVAGKRLFHRFFFYAVLLYCTAAASHSHAAVEIPTPSWVTVIPIADKMIINGMPSTVQYFEAERKLGDLLDYYRQQWESGNGDKVGYREVDVDPWHVISKIDGRYLLTVQARHRNSYSTEGYLAIGDLKAFQQKKDRSRGIPKMQGSTVINDLTSYDPGHKGRTLLVVNTYSVASNSEFYRKHYLSRGWGQVMDQGSDNAQVLAFRRFGKEAHLVISRPGGKTRVVMNLVEGD